MISVLTNAPPGLRFGQLWQGEAVHARRELSRTLGKNLKMSVVAEKATDGSEDEDKCLAFSVIRICGQVIHALRDSGTAPNVMSPGVVKNLLLSPEETSRVVTVASGA